MKLFYRFVNYFGFLHGLKLFVKFKIGHVTNVKLPNLKHSFDLRPNTTDIPIFYQVFFNQSYENFYGDHINTIIDAGANIGLASVFYANKFPNAKIIALEPQSDNFNLLCENTNKYENVTPIKMALWGDRTSISVFDQGYGESGFMISAGDDDNATTIDDIMKLFSMDRIDILKIDIEGSEKEVFEGTYQNWLPHVKCLIIELHDDMRPGSSKAVFAAISKFNFKLELRGENLFFFNLNLT